MLENNQKEIILLEDLGMKYPNENSKRKYRYGLFKCFCNLEFISRLYDAKYGSIKSCGCINTKHNLSNHRLYGTWLQMIQRCNNPKSKYYKNYGGRGISVCNEWLDINSFINDMFPSFIEGLTIDRENPNGNYEKSNCRWATKQVQNRNTRKLQSNNTSGYRGVYWEKRCNKWFAQIMVNYKRICIGYFDNKLDAAKAYDKYVIDNNLEHTLNFDRK